MTERRKYIRTIASSFAAAAVALQLAGCSAQVSEPENDAAVSEMVSTSVSVTEPETVKPAEESTVQNENKESSAQLPVTGEYTPEYSDKDLNSEWKESECVKITASGSSFSVDGTGVSAEGNILKITSSGTYLLSGKGEDVQVLIDSQDTKAVRLVFNGLSLTGSSVTPVYAQAADKVIITLADGTENSITDSSPAVSEDDTETPDAAVFCRSDLSINGNGKLTVISENREGISSKDKLKVVSGDISVRSGDDGIKGRDLVAVRSGNISIESSGDGIKSTYDKDDTKGSIVVEGGTLQIISDRDGIQAENVLAVYGGDIDITSGGGSKNGAEHTDNMFGNRGGFAGGRQQADTEDNDVSSKGMKSGAEMIVGSGRITVNSADDSLHAGTDLTINGGGLILSSGDDGLNASENLTVSGGEIVINESYEGIEARLITVNDGKICLKSSDDGMNASSDSITDEMKLVINGGSIFADAQGDGLDSNGDIEINGGYIIVSGPSSNNNGPLDCGDRNNKITINGGTLAAFGSSGMFELPDVSSKTNSVAASGLNAQAGTVFYLADSSDNVIIAFTCTRSVQAAVISAPEIKTGEKYILYSGGSYSGQLGYDGTGSGGKISGGTEAAVFEVSSSVTKSGEFFGGFGGGIRGGGRGDRSGEMTFGDGEVPGNRNPQNGMGGRTEQSGDDMPEGWVPHGEMIPQEGMEIPDGMGFPERMERPDGEGFGGKGFGGNDRRRQDTEQESAAE